MNDEWIGKAAAAVLLDCDERTIERRARANLITARARPGFPTLYLLADVEKLRQASPGTVHTGLLETVPTAATNGHGALASPRSSAPSIEGVLGEVLQAILRALTQGPTGPTDGPTGPTAPTLYVDVEEAAAILNWTPRQVRRVIRDGHLGCMFKERRDWRVWRIRRTDL